MVENKLRVLYLINDLRRGGAERSVTDLCLEFKKRGDIECVIATLFPENQFKETTKDLKVINLDFKGNRFLRKSYTPLYHKLVSDFKPHIIHSNLFLAEFLTLEKVYPDVVYVCHGRDNMPPLINFSWKTITSKRLLLNFYEKQRLVFGKYHKTRTFFVANSNHTKEYFRRVLPRDCYRNIELIWNGVDYEKFYFPSKRVIFPEKIVKLINVGSFQAKKNQKFLVDVAFYLKRNNLNFEIKLVGDGDYRLEVENLVRAKKLENEFIFHGNVKNVEELYKESDIYIHSAHYEPFGIVFLEAMAAGLPVVTLDGKGNRDLIKENYNGFLLEEENPECFANRIIELIYNKNQYSELSENCKEFSRKFNMKEKAQEFFDFYSRILKSNISER